MVWALEKAAFYSKGAPVIRVYSDHSALVSLCSKELTKMPNPLLINMLERLSDFNYTVTQRPGSKNHVADFLSRYPSTSQGAPSFSRHRASVLVRTVKADRIRRETV